MKFFSVLLLIFTAINLFGISNQCEKIEMPVCFDMPYDLTLMPNFLGHTGQKEAAEAIEEYLPLIKSGCSRFLRFFLCSKYAPVCSMQNDGSSIVVPPCKTLCLEVKSDCSSVLKSMNLSWPSSLACWNLPWSNTANHFCVNPPKSTKFNHKLDSLTDASTFDDFYNAYVEYDDVDFTPKTSKKDRLKPRYKNENWFKLPIQEKVDGNIQSSNCPQHFIYDSEKKKCLGACSEDIIMNRTEKLILKKVYFLFHFFILLISLLFVIFTSSGVSILEQPQKNIFYISLSNVFCSSLHVFILGLILMSENSQKDTSTNSQIVETLTCNHLTKTFIYNKLSNYFCNLISLAIFYTEISVFMWFTMTNLSWFLSTFFKWSQESVSSIAFYQHLVSWMFPAVLCVVSILSSSIEADPLLGFCRIGVMNKKTIMNFKILFEIVVLMIGGSLQVIGFLSTSYVLKQLKSSHQNKDAKKLKKIIYKMLIFTILFSLPLAINIYNNINLYFINARLTEELKICETSNECHVKISLKVIYLARVLVSFTLSLSPIIWISWKKLFHKLKMMLSYCSAC